MRFWWYPWLGCMVCLALSGRRADAQPPRGDADFFEKSIRPLLANNCFECHGPKKQKAKLRLDSREGMLTGGDSGPVVVPGKPQDSLIIKAIHYIDDELKMPPKGPLAKADVEAVSKWIERGAPWPQATLDLRSAPHTTGFKITPEDRAFWSFQAIADPALPKVRRTDWPKTSIDSFVLAKLEANKLQPAEPADRRTLLRRATFDLIGLPPTPEESEAFLNDSSPDAFAKVVDRLLASPHYGERWARHWLDLARYGEDQAHTFQARKYPQGFRYRDWLIKAFNADMAYDRFVREQLAADLLARPAGDAERLENLPALGFFALGPVYYGDRLKLDQIDDRIDTLTRGLLGLTVACARCHDHKYDPIATKDYYALAGVVAGTEYVEVSLEPGKEGEALVLPSPKDQKKAAPKGPFIHAVKEGAPTTMRVHIRGNPNMLGEEAPRRMMAILARETAPTFTGSGRLDLANAIATKDNPLTARVIVNRVWQHHFGKGLVRTPSNFGALGERPTHPELLDHLASRFIASGWSLKALHREIMLSATYQLGVGHVSNVLDHQAGWKPPSQEEIDPENRLLWRMNRRRLEVEAWRDAMLAVSGQLDRTIGGASGDLASADYRRRTLYGSVSRHELNPLLRLFDFPDPNITSDERTVTTVPLQQLFVLNSEFLVANAKALAARLAKIAPDHAACIRHAFLLLYGRPATEREVQIGLDYLAVENRTLSPLSRLEQYAQVLLSTNEFLYVD